MHVKETPFNDRKVVSFEIIKEFGFIVKIKKEQSS